MNKLCRFFVSVLCAVIAVSVMPNAIYAATGGGISVSTDSVKAGDTFRVIITVPKTENADTAAIRAEFDPSAFEVTSWSPTLANSMSNSGDGFIALTSANATRIVDLSKGAELTATLTVKKNAANGKYPIALKSHSLSYVLDNGYDYKELWTPSVTTVYVTVTNSSAPAVTTSTANAAVTTSTTAATNATTSKTSKTTAKTDTPSSVKNTNDSDSDTTKAPDSGDDDEEDEEQPWTWEDGESYYDDEYSDGTFDPDDPEDSEYDPEDEDDESDEKSEISITPVLGGISSGQVKINTKSSFFDNSTDIKLSNSVDAQTSASSALKDLGLERHRFYPFDISVFDTVRNRTIKDMGDGYIDISIPVPDKLKDAGSDLAVYHIADGIADLVYSNVFTDDGIRMIKFRATSFSPYMIVDMVGEVSGNADTNVYKLGNTSSSSGGTISGGSSSSGGSGNTQAYAGGTAAASGNTGKSGPVNPNTGVAAAIVIPSALVGCAFLSRKVVRKRKRTRRYIEE